MTFSIQDRQTEKNWVTFLRRGVNSEPGLRLKMISGSLLADKEKKSSEI